MGKKSKIKNKILENLLNQGFQIDDDGMLRTSSSQSKNYIRNLHKHSKNDKIRTEGEFLKNKFEELKIFFADGSQIDPYQFDPYFIEVQPKTIFSELFRFATLLWSIPVSLGFGRRLRFLVFDKQNDKLVGLFALGDPVFNLNVRDQLVGWDQAMRRKRLYNVMDMFVVGAVPPYSNLLCGKLMALLGTSNEVRYAVWRKYHDQFSTISNKNKKPDLVLLTTSSALGRSSQYNRIKYHGQELFSMVGKTEGWGHFHLSNSTFSMIRDFLLEINHPIVKANRFGHGPNWKIRTLRTGLELLDLPTTMLNHGIKRHVYIAPLAKNYKSYLLGLTTNPIYYNYSANELIEYFIERWFVPRSIRCVEYKNVTADSTLKELEKIAFSANRKNLKNGEKI